MMHLTKDVTKGLASTKCGLQNQSMFSVTVWWREVTCPECNPMEWVPAPPVGLKMVRKTSTSAGASTTTPKPRRKLVRVTE